MTEKLDPVKVGDIWYERKYNTMEGQRLRKLAVLQVKAASIILGIKGTPPIPVATVSRRTNRAVGDSGYWQPTYCPVLSDEGHGLREMYAKQVARDKCERALAAVTSLHKAKRLSIEKCNTIVKFVESLELEVGTVQQTRREETPDSKEHEFTRDYELVDTGAPNPDRNLRYIRNAVQSYRAGGDMAAAIYAIGMIERILEEGQVPEQSALEAIGAAAVAHRVATSSYYSDVNGVTAKDYIATVERLESLITDYVAGQSSKQGPVLGTTYGGDAK